MGGRPLYLAIAPNPEKADAWHHFTCGHCGAVVNGLIVAKNPGNTNPSWIVCLECRRGSVLNDSEVVPPARYGLSLAGLPSDVEEAYDELRICVTYKAYTAAEVMCRKLLMHVAVDKGADPGKSFTSYLDYLESRGYIAPTMKGWIDLIRKHGNAATHELPSSDRERVNFRT